LGILIYFLLDFFTLCTSPILLSKKTLPEFLYTIFTWLKIGLVVLFEPCIAGFYFYFHGIYVDLDFVFTTEKGVRIKRGCLSVHKYLQRNFARFFSMNFPILD